MYFSEVLLENDFSTEFLVDDVFENYLMS